LVGLDEWVLALHVLSGFAYVAGLMLFWVLVVAVRNADTPERTMRMAPIAMVGNVSVGIGALGTIVLGIFLAFSYGGYDIWDPWIIAALVLWVAAAATGSRTGAEYMKGQQKAQELHAAGQTGPSAELLALNRTSNGVVLHAVSSAIVLLIVIDMIWKPGS
jgi:uncharacterized membrane protein